MGKKKMRAELESLRKTVRDQEEALRQKSQHLDDMGIRLTDAQRQRDRFASALNKVDALLAETGHGVVGA